MARLVVALLAAAALGACATPYAPRDLFWGRQGYEDERLGARTWIVRVGAGFQSESRRLSMFALYRAAEIATAHGFTYFLVQDGDATGDLALYAPGAPPAPPVEGGDASPSFGERFKAPGRTRVARLRIRLVEEDEIAGRDNVVDARAVLARLAPVVGR